MQVYTLFVAGPGRSPGAWAVLAAGGRGDYALPQ
jgi:hypothetical protein